MKLDKAQLAQAQQAILGGYDRKSLQIMVRLELGEDLDAIAGDDELDVMIFHLLMWAEREHRLEDLIQGALAANLGNSELRHLAEDYGKWQEEATQSAMAMSDGALPVPSGPTHLERQRKPRTMRAGNTGLAIAALLVVAAALLFVVLRSFPLPSAPASALGGSAAASPTAAPSPTAADSGLPVTVDLANDTSPASAAVTQPAPAKDTAEPLPTPTEPVSTPTQPVPTPLPTEPAPGTLRILGGVPFVYVPAGKFWMGSTEAQVNQTVELCLEYWQTCKRDTFEDEQPQQLVDLDGFWIMQTEVTNALWQRFMNDGGYDQKRFWSNDGWTWRSDNDITQPGCWTDPLFSAGEQPVVCVSWYEVEAFARWFSEETGREEKREIRLPTEAEWEKAARGTEGQAFPWGNKFDNPRLANYCDGQCEHGYRTRRDNTDDDGYKFTAPVGSYPGSASPYGALDMAGNVYEWVADWYAVFDDGSSPTANPTGPPSGWGRVVRGGSWTRNPDNLRASDRHGEFMDRRPNDLGVRLTAPDF